jgi:hypothetical protein
MDRTLVGFKAVMDHPAIHLLVGLILILTGIVETYHSLTDESRAFRVAAHHGIMVLGLFQVLQSLPSIIEGLRKWLQALEKGKRPDRQSHD